MSTRATIHFCEKGSNKPIAIIYRHSDGYPAGLGQDLKEFFRKVKAEVKDNRFNDPAYLAAKWVVWDAEGRCKALEHTHQLDFLGVGIVMEDPSDIEYRYRVICNNSIIGTKIPTLTCEYPDGTPVSLSKKRD